MRERFVDWRPNKSTAWKVEAAMVIAGEYREQGLKLTLRQLYYQFVSRDLIANSEREYKNLGTLLGKARMAGFVDWDAIEDRNRVAEVPWEFDSPASFMASMLPHYRRERWAGQATYVELWVEKEALAGVLRPLADEHHVTLMVNKGYSSLSAMYESAQRIVEATDDGMSRDGMILYLGDLDPSGEDMVRDIRDRLKTFARGGAYLEVEKIALTKAQVEQYKPPPNPTKLTDSRARGYIEKYGMECWEVDALDPPTLQQLIHDSIAEYLDTTTMAPILEREEQDIAALRRAAEEVR